MHGLIVLITSFAKFESTYFFYKFWKLLFYIHFISVINLKSNILNRVLLESQQIFLTRHEKWQWNVEQNLFNMWFYHHSCFFQVHALSKEFDGEGQCFGTNELGLSGHENVDVAFVKSSKVWVLEHLHECFDLLLVGELLILLLICWSTSDKHIIILKSNIIAKLLPTVTMK